MDYVIVYLLFLLLIICLEDNILNDITPNYQEAKLSHCTKNVQKNYELYLQYPSAV